MALTKIENGIQILLTAEEEADILATWAAPREIPIISVTPCQIRKALNQLGLRDAVENTVAASDDQELKDEWEFRTSIVRNNPLVLSMAVALNKTPEEIDTLFLLASTL